MCIRDRRHGVQVPRGVEQGLALDRRRRRARDVDRVGREPLGRDLERGARAGRRLEEQVDDGLAPQRRYLLYRPLVDLEEAVPEIHDGGDLGRGKRLDTKQMAVRKCAHGRRSRSTTRSTSPRSARSTRTDSPAVVSTVTPTMSG